MRSLTILVSLAVVAGVAFASPLQDQKKLVCYYGSWAVYRPGNGKFDVEDMDPMICTHLIFGFTGIEEDGSLKVLDPYNELEDNWGRGALRRFTNMKQVNPDLKTLLAVGGWNEGSEKYSSMASTAAGRKRFIDSVIPLLEQYNFDGFDLDWEYPTQRGGNPEDKANFVLLCQELKAEFAPRGWLLTAAVSAGTPTVEAAYDVPGMSAALDFINVMAYDFHGGWETFTHHQSPMGSLSADTGNNTLLNVKHAIEFWIEKGAPPSKLILGIGSYGRGWLLDDQSVNGFYAPASQLITAGPYTREPGIWGYNEVLEQQAAGGWTIMRDADVVGPVGIKDRMWIGYDDEESVAARVQYAMEMGLGGAMFWSIETDDFRGLHSSETFPLLKTARRGLLGDVPTAPPTTPTTTDPTATTTTTTTTTPGPTPPSDGVCSGPGPNRNPLNCRSFFICSANTSGGYDATLVSCPTGTIYSPPASNCVWESDVPNADELCKDTPGGK